MAPIQYPTSIAYHRPRELMSNTCSTFVTT